jgi:hypothetical protein
MALRAVPDRNHLKCDRHVNPILPLGQRIPSSVKKRPFHTMASVAAIRREEGTWTGLGAGPLDLVCVGAPDALRMGKSVSHPPSALFAAALSASSLH